MTEHSYYSIPIELMEILTKINDNINDVKERLARIEGQDHTDSIKSLRLDYINLKVQLENVKTKLAPIVVGISMAGAVVIELLIKSLP